MTKILKLLMLTAILFTTISCTKEEVSSSERIKAKEMITAIENNTAHKLPGYLCSGKQNGANYGIYNSGGIWYYAVWDGGHTEITTISPNMAFELCM